MKEELILYKQAKQLRELAKGIVRDLLAVNLRKDMMSKAFLQTLEQNVDHLIAQAQGIKQQLRQLQAELEDEND